MTTKHGSLSEQEIKRLQGGELILNGYENNDIAEIVGVSLCAVRKWRKKLANNNDDSVAILGTIAANSVPNLTALAVKMSVIPAQAGI